MSTFFGISSISSASPSSQLPTVGKAYPPICVCFPYTLIALLFFLLLRSLTKYTFLGPLISNLLCFGVLTETIAMLLVAVSALFVNLYSVVLIALQCFILWHLLLLGVRWNCQHLLSLSLSCARNNRLCNYNKNCKLWYLLYTHTDACGHTQRALFYHNLLPVRAHPANILREKD